MKKLPNPEDLRALLTMEAAGIELFSTRGNERKRAYMESYEPLCFMGSS